jgi:hypothetical protein
MGLFGLCEQGQHDPLVDALRDTFDANIVRVPEARIQPLRVLAAKHSKCTYQGELTDLLKGTVPDELSSTQPATDPMANVSGKKSSKVEAGLGLEILGGFLSALNIPSAGLSAKFGGAKEVSFTFGSVSRRYINPSLIGRALNGQAVDPDNTVGAIFFGDDPWHLIVVDSVITSSDFTLSVDKASSNDFSIDVPAIQDLVGQVNAKVKVESSSSRQITFAGPEALTFAFSSLRLFLDSDGRITRTPPESGLFMADGRTQKSQDVYRWKVDERAMLEMGQ